MWAYIMHKWTHTNWNWFDSDSFLIVSFFGVVADLFSEHIGVAQGVYKGSASRARGA